MTTKKLHELHEKTMKVLNLRSYIEEYDESIGISKENMEKNLFISEIDLENFLAEATPTSKIIDSVVFTAHNEEPILIVAGIEELYIGGAKEMKNYRVSLSEI